MATLDLFWTTAALSLPKMPRQEHLQVDEALCWTYSIEIHEMSTWINKRVLKPRDSITQETMTAIHAITSKCLFTKYSRAFDTTFKRHRLLFQIPTLAMKEIPTEFDRREKFCFCNLREMFVNRRRLSIPG